MTEVRRSRLAFALNGLVGLVPALAVVVGVLVAGAGAVRRDALDVTLFVGLLALGFALIGAVIVAAGTRAGSVGLEPLPASARILDGWVLARRELADPWRLAFAALPAVLLVVGIDLAFGLAVLQLAYALSNLFGAGGLTLVERVRRLELYAPVHGQGRRFATYVRRVA